MSSVKWTRRMIRELSALEKRLVVLSGAGVRINKTQRKALQSVLLELRTALAFHERAEAEVSSRHLRVLREMTAEGL